MVLKLHGVGMSTCTRRVALIAKERSIPYELVAVDFAKSEHKSPAHLAHQPFGQVPYIVEEDGFELFESRAIGRYIATMSGGKGPALIPTERKALAKFEQAASIEQNNFEPLASGIVVEKIFKPFRGATPDEARVAELLPQLEAKLDAYEVILGKQKYLAGDEITLADLFHLPYGSWLVTAGFGSIFEKRPNVNRWWSELTTRPSWLAVKDGA